ncbi:type II toxin-antitoxin system mRNA interferase toxin, RelE/StbE family, partial [Listeria monocytogenes]|nr:type II toxin-antitoxin system mRNA interferase toxin, RelE/StbE family [Listeria monocytogenes]EAF0494295.1 type II toxin-antitoxin system mRNA interferase toxin, RelE/StbE family [Listeria monocytogenes]EAF1264926.1 type II toxin-antitoxin system mRNA interferase toxin, RelE/StbE family [Listeria monocytogenes]EMC7826199.1 type II toxin-antitoxin system YafQ family toxin [Listeria monocytogenes]
SFLKINIFFRKMTKWECHISPDWLLIYMISEDNIILVRTGTHSDLF